jgi:hypothetical protein
MKKDIKRKKFEQSENLEKNDKSIKKNHKNTNKNIKKKKLRTIRLKSLRFLIQKMKKTSQMTNF